MSLPADITIDIDAPPLRGSDVLAQLNNAIEEIRVLRTGLAALAVAYNAQQTKLDTLATSYNASLTKLDTLSTAYNATLTKLDGDAGVTSTDYHATNPGATDFHATNPGVIDFASGSAVVATAYATDSKHIAHKIHKH